MTYSIVTAEGEQIECATRKEIYALALFETLLALSKENLVALAAGKYVREQMNLDREFRHSTFGASL